MYKLSRKPSRAILKRMLKYVIIGSPLVAISTYDLLYSPPWKAAIYFVIFSLVIMYQHAGITESYENVNRGNALLEELEEARRVAELRMHLLHLWQKKIEGRLGEEAEQEEDSEIWDENGLNGLTKMEADLWGMVIAYDKKPYGEREKFASEKGYTGGYFRQLRKKYIELGVWHTNTNDFTNDLG